MNSEIVIYQNNEGDIKLDVRLEEETIWLTQAQLYDLFQKSKATNSEHIKNLFVEGELDEKWLFGNSEQPLNMVQWLIKRKSWKLMDTILMLLFRWV